MGRSNPYPPVRSVRVEDQLWARAQKRAKAERLTMSEVLHRFVEGYANGRINAPQVQTVFTNTRAET